MQVIKVKNGIMWNSMDNVVTRLIVEDWILEIW